MSSGIMRSLQGSGQRRGLGIGSAQSGKAKAASGRMGRTARPVFEVGRRLRGEVTRPTTPLLYAPPTPAAATFVAYPTTPSRTYWFSCPNGRGLGHPEGYPGPVGAKNPVGTEGDGP
jgi:hypothetical protein